MRAVFFVAVALCILSAAMAFVPSSLPALRTAPKTLAVRPLRMAVSEEESGVKDLSKGNDPISILLDSVKRLFKKSEDDYPPGDGQGFTQTPKKPTRNKGEW
mmetsp:Transcript_16271/g.33428  ORF Transcript_16271/g.33428 Transcript_16271/m.33428 type:complete len:102 (-) Transcript_16271:44-349(-)